MANADAEKNKLAHTQAFVTKQYTANKKEGAIQGTDEVIAIHKFISEPARVEVSLGLTLNLGNFESARLSVGVTVPCYKEETDAAFEFAKEWVASRVATEVKNIREKGDTSIL